MYMIYLDQYVVVVSCLSVNVSSTSPVYVTFAVISLTCIHQATQIQLLREALFTEISSKQALHVTVYTWPN